MEKLRKKIRSATFANDEEILRELLSQADFSKETRKATQGRAEKLVKTIRASSDPSMMELFLGEYGLSSDEGVALMCLAEALLRVPDTETIDVLIEDKIVPSEWSAHLGQSHSPMINASTWALFLTGKVLDEDKDGAMTSVLRSAIKRVGEPVIRAAVTRAMKEMGRQFVLGETIEGAIRRAIPEEKKGYTFSYDMLGEAAITARDAKRYHIAYADAISELASAATQDTVVENPGISIKLSALHPRYESLQRQRVLEELAPRALSLASLAKSAGIGLNIDAEEAARLDISLDVIERVLSDPALEGWDGFGVVVQAYSKRASYVIDWLYALAEKLDRKIMVRLVKGAYWDTEIKVSQVEGLPGFPVFSRKAATDVSYLACAKKLFGMTDRIYPQFATHNAHTVAGILEMAPDHDCYEFQRLHGMGEALHEAVLKAEGTKCRIYAPVGAHKDLLAYLVRRLLENGANSSFVNQIVDENVPPEEVAADPIESFDETFSDVESAIIRKPSEIFAPDRQNAFGWDLGDLDQLERLEEKIKAKTIFWKSKHLAGAEQPVVNPATLKKIGTVRFATEIEAQDLAGSVVPWNSPVKERSKILRKVADLYENNAEELFALLTAEAGKTLIDCIGELREAVDFLRYYSADAEKRDGDPRGVFTCISPWNFPLAIFTGQMAAALAAGNGVIAKPAEATSLIADRAIDLMYEAGVPKASLRLIAGEGARVGPVVTTNQNVNGICFTGSTATAKSIYKEMVKKLPGDTPLIAETGGINAMIVDSTALPEQAVTDILASAFQSAGQRCSALRVLYLQEDIADQFEAMLFGAMDALRLGNPSQFDTDIGPIIDAAAKGKITRYIEEAASDGRLLKQLSSPMDGHFVGPAVIEVKGIFDVAEEIFGPVLHIARFRSEELDEVIDDINATGYGLTFGLHTRIDDRVQQLVDRIKVGNIYVNRNQIGAVVGSQPFGGHGLSGTGPKAGGPHYLDRFYEQAGPVSADEATSLPGPTGEANKYHLFAKKQVYCCGPGDQNAQRQEAMLKEAGFTDIIVVPNAKPEEISQAEGLNALMYWGEDTREFASALATKSGKIIQISSKETIGIELFEEQVICIDTTASGGNAELLARSAIAETTE